jgi:UDP-glucuronate decarboxylase
MRKSPWLKLGESGIKLDTHFPISAATSVKRILVTGGAGFLGSHLCDHLLRDGHRVLCLDNLSSGHLSNIRHLRNHPRFEFQLADVVDPLDVQVDEIYNLACPASPPTYQADPIKTMRTCVGGALNVLELARRLNIKVLQASTSEVYGDPNVHPQVETYWGNVNPIGPRACYDEGKRAAETLFFDYRRRYCTQIKVVRIFNTYGPRMRPDDGRVVSNFIVQALQGQDITVYGSGEQTRSFCYVSDLVRGLSRFMATPSDVCGPLNLGNPEEFTIAELADVVVAMTGARSRISYCPAAIDDPRQRRPNITQARDLISWEPSVGLRNGLADTISYFDAVLKANAFTPEVAVA